MADWSQIVVGLSTFGAAVGSAAGQWMSNARTRKVVDRIWAEKERVLVAAQQAHEARLLERIEALEIKVGWTPRKRDQIVAPPPDQLQAAIELVKGAGFVVSEHE